MGLDIQLVVGLEGLWVFFHVCCPFRLWIVPAVVKGRMIGYI